MTEALVLYDAMLTAIAECARVDEVKDIRDKAAALQIYYRQARNLEAEKEAADVRLRAERRVGELLKDLARAPAGDRKSERSVSADGTLIEPSPYGETLAANGMSRQQAHRFQALAEVPQEEFDLALASGPATTAGIHARDRLRNAGEPDLATVTNKALWLWGRLRDFERERYLAEDPEVLFAGMTALMRADVIRLAPLVGAFLATLKEDAHVVDACEDFGGNEAPDRGAPI
jgi:hypothetical protein